MPHVHTFASKAVFNFSFQACFALMVPFAGYIYKNQLQHVSESFPNRKLIHVLSSKMSNSLQPCTLGAIKQSGRDWKSSCTHFHHVFSSWEWYSGGTWVESDASRRALESQVPTSPNLAVSAWSCYFCYHFTAYITSWVHNAGPVHWFDLES